MTKVFSTTGSISVKELKDILDKFPDDKKVCIETTYGYFDNYRPYHVNITKVFLEKESGDVVVSNFTP